MEEYIDKQNAIEANKIAETKFEEFWNKRKNCKVINVTNIPYYRNKDIDFIVSGTTFYGTFEVKNNYKIKNKNIIIELFDNVDPNLGEIRVGWYYYSKADYFIFMSKTTNYFIKIKNNKEFRCWFDEIHFNYPLIPNTPNFNKKTGKIQQSAFKSIPFINIPKKLCSEWYW
jgi:hypothetical protein